jgi:precorrin-3B methylase
MQPPSLRWSATDRATSSTNEREMARSVDLQRIEPSPLRVGVFGRERECAAVDRAVPLAASGQSSALVVRGDPGIGKTALLN